MERDMEKLTCTSCGGDIVRVYVKNHLVMTECVNCASTSELVVVVEPPKIEFRFGQGSQGTMSKE